MNRHGKYFAAFGLFLCFAFLPAAGAAQTRSQTQTYTLFASGDTMLARWVAYSVYQDGPEQALAGLHPLIRSSDIAMTNLECVVSTRGNFWNKGEYRPFLYRARPEMLDVLTLAGFDLVVTANNHSMDYGPEALLEQMALLEAAGMAQVGTGRNKIDAARPTYIKTGNMIVAFIGFEPYFSACAATEDSPGNFHSFGEESIPRIIKPLIAEARKHADLIVFTPHWGFNWTENASSERIRLAHAIIDLGVDAILGHSAHQLHGIEIYKGRLIVYDMGSFFFDTVDKNRMRKSAAFVMTFSAGGFTKLNIYPLLLHPNCTVSAPEAQSVEIKNLITRLSREIHPNIIFRDEGASLAVSFKPSEPAPARQYDPQKVHQTGRTRPLPQEMRKRKTNVVLNEPPAWCSNFQPVALQRNVMILGARIAEAARPGSAFTAEVALAAPGPLKDGVWAASIKGVNRKTGEFFIWRHPVADGGWLPPLWKKGQIVLDRTLVRPPELSEGHYELLFRMEEVQSQKVLLPKDPASGDAEGYVPVGHILIREKGVPEGPVGVAWDGRLSSIEPGGPFSPLAVVWFKTAWRIITVTLVVAVLAIFITAVFFLRRHGQKKK